MKKRIFTLLLTFLMTFNVISVDTVLAATTPIKVIVDGNPVAFDVEPVIENGRTLVPVRAIFEALGAQVEWDEATESVIATKGDTKIVLHISDTDAYINGNLNKLDVPAKLINSRTMVPVRFISESLECEVTWNDETSTVQISTYESPVEKLLERTNSNLRSIDNFTCSVNKTLKEQDTVLEMVGNRQVDMLKDVIYSSINLDITSTKEDYDLRFEILVEEYLTSYYYIDISRMWGSEEVTYDLSYEDQYKNFFFSQFLFDTKLPLELDDTSDKDYYILHGDDSKVNEMRSNFEMLFEDYMDSSEISDFEIQKSDYTLYIYKDTELPYKVAFSFEGVNKGNEFILSQEMVYDNYNKTKLNMTNEMKEQVEIYGTEEKLLELAESYMNIGNYEEAIGVYDLILASNDTQYEALRNIILIIYNQDIATEKIDYYLELFEKTHPKDVDELLQIGHIITSLRGYEAGINIYDMVLDIDPRHAETLNYIGVAYYYLEDFEKAIDYFDKAIRYEDGLDVAYINKAEALYSLEEYAECIEFIEDVLSTASDDLRYELRGYQYGCYYDKNEMDSALEVLETMAKEYPNDEDVIVEILYLIEELQIYEDIEEYLKQLKEISPNHGYIEYYEDLLVSMNQPLNVQIYDFIKNNYLYYDEVENFESKSKDFLSLKKVTSTDVENYLNSIVIEQDYFTYAVMQDDYDEQVAMQDANSVQYEQKRNDVAYIKISEFNTETYNEFIKIMDQIGNKEDKKLVIDLRNNFGGDTYAANKILDYLLDDCVTSTFISRDGYTYSNYSDEANQQFKSIDIYVNKFSASSSELLTLGLKTYLDNVTIIGQRTFGKGVGQYVFDDKENKVMIVLTSFYWNVKQNNVHYYGITPDIEVEMEEDSYYFDTLDR